MVTYDFSGIPDRIRQSRENYANRAGMSREQLGEHAGVSRQAVARWEQPYDQDRNSVPDLETLSRIAEVLRIDFLWLLTGRRYVEIGKTEAAALEKRVQRIETWLSSIAAFEAAS